MKKVICRCYNEAWNWLVATIVDLWNFHIYPKIRVDCPCCRWKGSGFVANANEHTYKLYARCPSCDARSRHRGLAKYLRKYQTEVIGRRTLIFAPERVIIDVLNSIEVYEIFTTDYNSTDVDLPGEDIQDLSFQNQSFEYIICNHVLEHIPDDRVAIAECARVLTSDGIALFTVPGDFNIQTTQYFEQLDSNGHYRYYGLDFVDKCKEAFQFVDVVDMSTLASPEERVPKSDMLFVCKRAGYSG